MSVVVIVPTYNETDTIGTLVERVRAAEPRADLLVVDDASPDGTGDLVASITESDPRVHLLRREGKNGLGTAYRAGFAWALERGYDVVVEMDADLSHPADRLPALIDALDDADLSIGSRYVPGGATENWPASRQLISRAGNVYVRLALGLGVNDATAGFRAFRADTLRRIDALSLTSEGYCFQVETTHAVVGEGLRVAEVPITFTEREHGQSKMSRAIVAEALLRVTGWGISDLVGRGRRRRADQGPRRVAAIGAAAVLVGGVVWGGAAIASTPDDGADTPSSQSTAPAGQERQVQPGAIDVQGQDDVAAPASITIPTIGVRSDLLGLGLEDDGELETPDDADLAGWYENGAVPGARGPAVIAGHVDSTSGPAVFSRLSELDAGDRIEVTDVDGLERVFEVADVETVEQATFPREKVYGPTPSSVLRLITCAGDYDPDTGYQSNVLVTAKPVE